MKASKGRRWSFAKERYLMELAKSSNSLEAIAEKMNHEPKTIAKIAMRLEVSFKPKAKGK